MDIAVVGSNNVDLITYIDRMPKLGETLEAPDFEMGCGGKGANQAIAASRLGAQVRMVTRVGTDIFAANTVKNFADNGIDTEWVLETEGPSGVAPIFVDKDSNNSIVIVKGANGLLTPEDVAAAGDAIAECQLLVLQLEIPLETVYAAIDLAVERGVPVLLNPAPADPALDMAYVGKCTYFVPNETELSLLVGRDAESLDEIRDAGAEILARSELENLIVTLGSRGSLWLTRDDEVLVPAHAVDAVDSTGAGDAFIGCFSTQITRGLSVPEALEQASLYAANSVTKRGTQYSYATADEFEEWKNA
ncbi:ribokinase [Flaviflexus equikiangi]|uniref:ribokinase n=1 Tax=Flaviflexus equikiangi TaxID=2758573 RepID=UPI0015F3BBF4|nr:ribokinase [Flaviflexus equikiangi]